MAHAPLAQLRWGEHAAGQQEEGEHVSHVQRSDFFASFQSFSATPGILTQSVVQPQAAHTTA